METKTKAELVAQAESQKRIDKHNFKLGERPTVFRRVYARTYQTIRKQLFAVGRGAYIGKWGSGTRQRARKLAREMARFEIRENKRKNREDDEKQRRDESLGAAT